MRGDRLSVTRVIRQPPCRSTRKLIGRRSQKFWASADGGPTAEEQQHPRGQMLCSRRGQLVGCFLEDTGLRRRTLPLRPAGVAKTAWENSRWHTNSFRAVDEFEYLYFWKPGIHEG